MCMKPNLERSLSQAPDIKQHWQGVKPTTMAGASQELDSPSQELVGTSQELDSPSQELVGTSKSSLVLTRNV